jgi:hypothetical protein
VPKKKKKKTKKKNKKQKNSITSRDMANKNLLPEYLGSG